MADDSQAETLRSRVDASRLTMWLLLDGHRWLVTVTILGAVFLALFGLVVADPVGLVTAIEASDPIETMFQALITGIITGVTLVASSTR